MPCSNRSEILFRIEFINVRVLVKHKGRLLTSSQNQKVSVENFVFLGQLLRINSNNFELKQAMQVKHFEKIRKFHFKILKNL